MAGQGNRPSATLSAVAPAALLLTGMLALSLASSFAQTSTSKNGEALPVGKEQPALSTALNGPTAMAYSNGQLFVMELAGRGIWSLDTVRQTASLILPPTAQPYTHERKILGSPFAIAVSYNGDVFVGDVGGKLAQINPDTHSASVRRADLLERFPQIHAMAADTHNGTIVLIDRHMLLRWTPDSNELERLAGGGPGFSGDGGPAKDAAFKWPQGLAIDMQGNIFVADTENCRLRRIDAETGTITTISGGITCDSSGDGQPARVALVKYPRALAADSHGNVFLSEGCRVRRIDSKGIIATYAGIGVCGFSGDGELATTAMVSADGLAVDDRGNLYISTYGNNRVRCVDGKTHRINTFAGNGEPFRVDVVM